MSGFIEPTHRERIVGGVSDANDSVAQLLAQARLEASIPPHEERVRLRKAAGFSLEQIGAAVGVTRAAVSSWEKPRTEGGNEPRGDQRTRYARLLSGLAEIHPPPASPHRDAAAEAAAQGPADTASAPPPVAPPRRQTAQAPTPTVTAESPAARQARTAHHRHHAARRTTSAEQARSELAAHIDDTIETELARAAGDQDAAAQALVKRAIPDVMALFHHTRKQARYEHTAYPRLPAILQRPTKNDPDLIWEARPSWRHPQLRRSPDGPFHVTALDVNAAYLAAFTTHLPIGRLEHSADGTRDPKRAGFYLIDPPAWFHPDLPHPLGNREEPGPLWIGEPTLRLLLRLAGPKHGLLEAPTIHESWTSGSSEGLLKQLRATLADARTEALEADNDVKLEYIKAMYSKFVSTLGESVHNREIVRPDWTHLIRSQAFANLWNRAHKAHEAGLGVVAVLGTDELHVAGDWRQAFNEGRGLGDMKIKHDREGHPVDYTVKETA